MPREKKEAESAAEAAAPHAEETMEVKLRGSASKVMERLSGDDDRRAAPPAAAEPPKADEEFVKELGKPDNILIVKRISPREGPNGEKLYGEVLRLDCPTLLQDVHDELTNNFGGRKYRLGIINRDTGKNGPAMRYEIDADPVIEDPMITEEELSREQMLQGQRRSVTEMSVDQIDKESMLLMKQAEYERQKQILDDIRRKPEKAVAVPAGKDPATVSLEARLLEMERREMAFQYQSKIDALQREINQIKAAPKQDDGQTTILKLLMDQQRKSDERFERMMEAMQNQKLDAMMSEVKALRNSPVQKESAFTERIMEKALASLLGDDEEDDEPEEEKPWYERLAMTILDKVDVFKEKEKTAGRPLTREEVLKEAESFAAQEAAKIKQEMGLNQRGRTQVQALPPPQVPGAAVPPPVSPPSPMPPPQVPASITPEDQVRLRVALCLAELDAESASRPKVYNWNLKFWDELPEDALDAVCAAQTVEIMVESLARFVDKKEAVAEFLAKIQSNPKLRLWIERGMNELKEWQKRAEEDPKFDPGAETEGGE